MTNVDSEVVDNKVVKDDGDAGSSPTPWAQTWVKHGDEVNMVANTTNYVPTNSGSCSLPNMENLVLVEAETMICQPPNQSLLMILMMTQPMHHYVATSRKPWCELVEPLMRHKMANALVGQNRNHRKFDPW